jgi:uncharacterized protein YdeI (YjbR/CyaY-like superfamily)
MSHRPELQRARHAVPEFVRAALDDAGLMTAYHARPTYQQNDYIGWITRAEKIETRERRLAQMLDELREGGVYMGMAHGPSRKS